MKKKFIALLLASTLALSSTSVVFADEKDDKIVELQKQVDEMQKTIDDLNAELDKYRSQDQQGNSMEDYLLDKNLLSGDRIEMAADMVGALSGFKYGDTEIYEYVNKQETGRIPGGGNPAFLCRYS